MFSPTRKRANSMKPFCWHMVCCSEFVYFGSLPLGTKKFRREFAPKKKPMRRTPVGENWDEAEGKEREGMVEKRGRGRRTRRNIERGRKNLWNLAGAGKEI